MTDTSDSGNNREPNNLLLRARLARASALHPRRRFSRQEVADAANAILAQIYRAGPRRPGHAGLTAGYVGALERGEIRWPNDDYRRALRTLYGMGDADLGFYIDRPDGASARTALARAALPVLARADPTTNRGRTLVLPADAESWNHAAGPVPAHRAGLGPPLETSSFAALTQLLASQRQLIAPDALVSLVEAHRDTLRTLFQRAASDPVRTDIGALLGETSIVASRLWSAMGNRAMALAHCAFARKLADRLDNPQLQPSPASSKATCTQARPHSSTQTAMSCSDFDARGDRRPPNPAAPRRKGPDRGRQAQAYAALTLDKESMAALTRHEPAVEHIDDTDRAGLFSDWTPSRLRVYEGTCLLLLGQTDQAAQVLTVVTRELDDDPGNLNVALAAKVDIASAHVHSGELEEGCNLLGSTHAELVKLGNRRGISRAIRARERLTRWQHDPVVRELDSRMLDAAKTATGG